MLRSLIAALLLLPCAALAQTKTTHIILTDPNSTGEIGGMTVTATGGTTARTGAARAADVTNLIDKGACGNARTGSSWPLHTTVLGGGSVRLTVDATYSLFNDPSPCGTYVGATIGLGNLGTALSTGGVTSIPAATGGAFNGGSGGLSIVISGAGSGATAVAHFGVTSAAVSVAGTCTVSGTTTLTQATGSFNTPAQVVVNCNGSTVTSVASVAVAGDTINPWQSNTSLQWTGTGASSVQLSLVWTVTSIEIRNPGYGYSLTPGATTVSETGGNPTTAPTLGTPVVTATPTPFVTTIASVVDGKNVILAAAPPVLIPTTTTTPMEWGTDDSTAVQACINSGKRCLVNEPTYAYMINGITMPTNGRLIGLGKGASQFFQAPGATNHLFTFATSSAVAVELAEFSVFGGLASLASPTDLFHFDGTGGGGGISSIRAWNIDAESSSGDCWYFGYNVREVQTWGMKTYKCGLHGLEANNADSIFDGWDIGQSGSDGVYTSASHVKFSNVNSWLSGATNPIANGFACFKCQSITGTNIGTQQSWGIGLSLTSSGTNLTPIVINGYNSDSDCVGGINYNSIYLFRAANSVITGTITDNLSSGAYSGYCQGPFLGTSPNSRLILSQILSHGFPLYGDTTGNVVEINGTDGFAATTFSSSFTLTPYSTINPIFTLTGNMTINNPNVATGATIAIGKRLQFLFQQDATGSRTVTFGSQYVVKNAGWLTSTASAWSSISFRGVAAGVWVQEQ